MKFHKNCIESVRHVLSVSKLYSINNFSYKLTENDVGIKANSSKDILTSMRNKWLYGYYGLYTNLSKFINPADRIIEKTYNYDLNSTLRQKMNIVSEMMDANFTSSMPLHISVTLKENVPTDKIVVIDNENGFNTDDIDMIIHPGQTRAQCSVFCRRSLNNVLLYIPRKYSDRIVLKNFKSIKSIETQGNILDLYNTLPSIKESRENITVSINTSLETVSVDSIENNMKVHEHPFENYSDFIPVVKAWYMSSSKLPSTSNSVHPSDSYIDNSFKSFDYFMSTVHNSKLKIYSNLSKKSLLKVMIDKHRKNLQSEESINLILENNESKVAPTVPLSTFFLKMQELLGSNYKAEFYNIIAKLETTDVKWNSTKESKLEIYTDPEFIPTVKLDPSEIVKHNEYKGFCLYIDKTIAKHLYRDVYELLFFTNWDVSITKSIDSSIAIINCEHEYWKTGNNYKEWILTKEMYYE